jgi:CRP/FNR family cyclic AMP-dependent transcriptional regulator
MPCDPKILKQVPLFALFDDDETALLASKVDMKTFSPRQRIYKTGDA